MIKKETPWKFLRTRFLKTPPDDCFRQGPEYVSALYAANICLFKVNNRKFRKRCEICSKLTKETPKRRQMLAGYSFGIRGFFFSYRRSEIALPHTIFRFLSHKTLSTNFLSEHIFRLMFMVLFQVM